MINLLLFSLFVYEKGLLGYKCYFMSFGQANYMDIVAYDDVLNDSIKFVLDEIIRNQKECRFLFTWSIGK